MSVLDKDDAAVIGGRINYEEVDSLSQKRIIAFFNEFVCQTVSFLNKFSAECEDKLIHLDTRLEKLETMVSLLETKLSSVPGLATTQNTSSQNGAVTNAEPVNVTQVATVPDIDQSVAAQSDISQSGKTRRDTSQSSGLVPLRQTEPFRRFFRMLDVGVPEPAVRMKMQQEGLNCDVLQRGGELVSPPGDRDGSDASSWTSNASSNGSR